MNWHVPVSMSLHQYRGGETLSLNVLLVMVNVKSEFHTIEIDLFNDEDERRARDAENAATRVAIV